MSNLNDPHELEQEAAEITLPEGQDGGVDESYTSMQHGIPRSRAPGSTRPEIQGPRRKAVEASIARLTIILQRVQVPVTSG